MLSKPLKRKQLLHNKEVFISCIVPVFNEAANIHHFLQALSALLTQLSDNVEIIVVDDGSIDETYHEMMPLIERLGIKYIRFSRNFGKEIALTAGLDHCQGKVAILIDADFQHPIEIIPQFLKKWAEGYDMVYGIRQNRATESIFKKSLSYGFYKLLALITKIDIPNNAGDFRLLDRKIITSLNTFKERTRFMKGLYAYVGFNTAGVVYDVKKRVAGKSEYSFARLAELALAGITSFSEAPLRIWGFMGFIISFISILYAIYLFTTTLIYGTDLPGFPTLAVAVIFFGGVQLLSIGILGEYIGRIFTEVKQRPHYIIEATHGFFDCLKE